ncbi:hypothetical protein EV126DRAFT_125536 [Verticillium dahliae]|nr:hypothetical protein EV126DRAFT_125536 [Verticillium dahliae]
MYRHLETKTWETRRKRGGQCRADPIDCGRANRVLGWWHDEDAVPWSYTPPSFPQEPGKPGSSKVCCSQVRQVKRPHAANRIMCHRLREGNPHQPLNILGPPATLESSRVLMTSHHHHTLHPSIYCPVSPTGQPSHPFPPSLPSPFAFPTHLDHHDLLPACSQSYLTLRHARILHFPSAFLYRRGCGLLRSPPYFQAIHSWLLTAAQPSPVSDRASLNSLSPQHVACAPLRSRDLAATSSFASIRLSPPLQFRTGRWF